MNNKYGPAQKSMDFGEAIGTCLKKYFVFEGRASKSEFWYFFLVYTVGSILLSFIARAVMSAPLLILAGLVTYGTIIPMISVGCRRLHDINKSGWWQCIPIYNLNKKLIGLKQFLKFHNNLIPEAILRNLMHIVQFLTHLRCLYFSTAHNNVHLSILWVIIYKYIKVR